MKINNLHPELKPKEKFQKLGIKQLNAIELLAIIINNGNQKYNALEIASNLLEKYKSINNLRKQSIDELTTNYGIGEQKAILLLAALNISRFETNEFIFSDFKKVKQYCKKLFLDNSYEKIIILFLSPGFELLIQKTITQISSHQVNFKKEEILNMAFRFNSKQIIIVHNHPNNNPIFSDADISSIKNLRSYLNKYGIEIIDNVLYTDNKIINSKG